MKKLIFIIALIAALAMLVSCEPAQSSDPTDTTPADSPLSSDTTPADSENGGGLEIVTDDDTRQWGEIIFPVG